MFSRWSVRTPDKTKDFETELLLKSKRFIKEQIKKGRPILIRLIFKRQLLKSMNKTKKKEALEYKRFPTQRPDLDNYIKTIDALQEIAWHDDSQVVCILSSKIYAETPSIQIDIVDISELFDAEDSYEKQFWMTCLGNCTGVNGKTLKDSLT